MQKIKNIIRTSILYVMALVVVGGTPMTVLAEGTPAEPPETYIYNPETKHWDSSKWRYDAATNTYVPVVAPQPTPPPAPANEPVVPESPVATDASSDASSAQANAGGSTATSNNEGTSSASTTTNADINNTLNSDAKTGNANVSSNTTGGNATSGNASADTTVVNTVHSTVGGDTSGVAHFTADINGDVFGDITLAPAINSATSTNTIKSDTNVTNNNSLTNNLNLNSTSGGANVSNNTTGGNATSGSANSVANVVNLINTIIAANKSFVGTINIYGNLNGDILISPEFIPQLIGSNADVTNSLDTSLSANLTNNQSIVNNVNLNATTGTATVANNTNAGSATTGAANTNLTILNLTGHEVTASNSLLVFVNVLGKWIGMIVDAPVGATAAALGNGVVSNKTTIDGSVDATNNSQITNNINLGAHSGDASVTGNTNGGSATTGNATASANIANISTSTFNLTDWFGVLFINVFGTWEGSFGINTANGDIVPVAGDAVPPVATELAPSIRFGFTPKPPQPLKSAYIPPVFNDDAAISATDTHQTPTAELVRAAVLGAQTDKEAQDNTASGQNSRVNPLNALLVAGGLTFIAAGALYMLIRRFFL